MTFNGNKLNLPRLVTIKLRGKFKIMHIMKKEPLLFHVMLKQGITWFTLASNTQETVQDNIGTFPDGMCSNASVISSMGSSDASCKKTPLMWR